MRSARARAFEQAEEYLLPVRFDDTDIQGMRPTVGYIDARRTSPGQLASLVAEKLAALSNPTSGARLGRDTHDRATPDRWWHGLRRPRIWGPLTGCGMLVAGATVWYALSPSDPSFPIPHEVACKPPMPQERNKSIQLEVNNLVEATYHPCLDHRDQNFHIEGVATVGSLAPDGPGLVEYTAEGDRTGYVKLTISGPRVDNGEWSALWQQNSSPDCWSQLVVIDPEGRRFTKIDTDCHPHR